MAKYSYIYYQLRETEENIRKRLFVSYDRVQPADLDWYKIADCGMVEGETPTDACENLYVIYNGENRPEHYRGRSMGVSDVVLLLDLSTIPLGRSTLWYCDNFGFKQFGRKVVQ